MPQPHPLCRLSIAVDVPPSADGVEAARKVLLLGATEMALSKLPCFTGQLQRDRSFGSIPTRDVQEEFGAELRAGPVTINWRACEATCTQGVKDGAGGGGRVGVQSAVWWQTPRGDRNGRWALGDGGTGCWYPLYSRACAPR